MDNQHEEPALPGCGLAAYAILLAIIPYLIFRGLTTRLAARRTKSS